METFDKYNGCPTTIPSTPCVNNFPKLFLLTLLGVSRVSFAFTPVRALSLWYAEPHIYCFVQGILLDEHSLACQEGEDDSLQAKPETRMQNISALLKIVGSKDDGG